MFHKENLTVEKLKKHVHQALKEWHKADVKTSPLSLLLYYQHTLLKNHGASKRATNQVLLDGLDALQIHHKSDATLLRRSFLDNELNRILAVERDISEAQLYRDINKALVRLTETLLQFEAEVQGARRETLLARLELSTYATLIAVEEHLDHLAEILIDPQQPWLIAIEGMGGIGKTSLADAVMRRLICAGQVQDVAWVTVRQQQFHFRMGIQTVDEPVLNVTSLAENLVAQLMADRPIPPEQVKSALQQRLKELPHLIVIDNLETLADVESLLSTLRMWANPTRFLLTSRESLFAEPDVYSFSVPELSEANAVALLQHEATQRNLTRLRAADEDALHAIVDTVGGNPLALRLVAGQTHVHPVKTVLETLRLAQGKKISELYTYIYRQAWEQLDEPTRQALLVMPLITAHGATLAELTAITGLARGKLLEAVENLVRLNLLDSRFNGDEPRYSIHSLTRTFLNEQVLAW